MTNKPGFMRRRNHLRPINDLGTPKKRKVIDVTIPANRPLRIGHVIDIDVERTTKDRLSIRCMCGESFEGERTSKMEVQQAALEHAMPKVKNGED